MRRTPGRRTRWRGTVVERITLPAWLARRGLWGALDHGDLSPSGRVSRRARDAARRRHQKRVAAEAAAIEEYHAGVDAGTIVDPSEEIVPRPNPKATDSRIQLEARIQLLAHFVAVGFQPRTSKRDLATAEAALAALAAPERS